jgi:hypothetical protein
VWNQQIAGTSEVGGDHPAEAFGPADGLPGGAQLSSGAPGGSSRAFGDLPWVFEPNVGQTDPNVEFLARRGPQIVYLTSNDLAILPVPGSSNLVRMRLQGGETKPRVEGHDPLASRSNYFVGSAREDWHSGVPHYGRVAYRDVYSGVDLIYYGSGSELEYDLVVAPGFNPDAIRLRFDGADDLQVSEAGDLVVSAGGATLVHRAPVIYQPQGDSRDLVEGNYSIRPDGSVGFEVARYDHGRPLVIDPRIVYSTFLSGSADDQAHNYDVAVDAVGQAYMAGITSSAVFPTENALDGTYGGSDDIFVAKLDASGSSLIYCTYLGGEYQEDVATIAVDAAGFAYVGGSTMSTDFPTFNAFQGVRAGSLDGFVTKLSPLGTAIVYSTYLGGNLIDYVRGIEVDHSGRAYVTGSTYSSNFPTEQAFQGVHGGGNSDAIVAKLSGDGSALVYSTYLGGVGDDTGYQIAVGPARRATITGSTWSIDFPTKKALQESYGGSGDGFVTQFGFAGTSLTYSTYLGGTGGDWGWGIDTDSPGSVYVGGRTDSSDLPTQAAMYGDAPGGEDGFIAKLNPTGAEFVYSTYFGSSGNEHVKGIAIDDEGNVYVVGTHSGAAGVFPTVNPFFTGAGTGRKPFLAKVDPSGTRLHFSGLFGSPDGDDWGYRVAVDSTGAAYVVGETNSTDFPVRNEIQGFFYGLYAAYITKIADNLDFWLAAADPLK